MVARRDIISSVIRGLVYLLGFVALYLLRPHLPKDALEKNSEVTFWSIYSWFITLIEKNLIQAIGIVAVLVFAGVIIWCLSLVAQRLVRALLSSIDRRHLVQLVGLSGYWPDAKPDASHAAWVALHNHVSEANNPILYILGSTGLDTFGREASPLWESIREFSGEVRIILLSPDSEYLPERAADVGMTEGEYREEIRAALEQIQRWRDSGHRISHRTYDSLPNWKIILTSRLVWVQYYRHRKHVQETPVYQFYATNGETGLYHLFNEEFARIWRLCGADSGAEPEYHRKRK